MIIAIQDMYDKDPSNHSLIKPLHALLDAATMLFSSGHNLSWNVAILYTIHEQVLKSVMRIYYKLLSPPGT